jgi:hypothetical protein
MKKVLVLMLVFGMASVASATLQISVNGEYEPYETEIFLTPSQTAIIDIWTDADILPDVGEGYWSMGVPIVDGSLTNGVGLGQGTDTTIYPGAGGYGYVPEGSDGPWGGVGCVTASSYPAGTKLYDEIIFHCEREGEATITLYWDPWGTQTPIDSVTIHQVPEPMTIALLGLGSLVLLRRRK